MTALPVSLPNGFSPLVKTGDEIAVKQKIAVKKSKREELISIPKQLSVSIRKAGKLLIKNPGDMVTKGDVLATKKGFLGFSKVSVISKVSGIVLRYERESGNLVIQLPESASPNEIFSPVEGIVGLCDNKQIVINTDKNLLIGDKSLGDKVQGEIFILKGEDPYFLDASSIGKIVIGRKLTREMLLKGIGIGVAGLVGNEISSRDVEYLELRKFKTAILELPTSSIEKITGNNEKKVFIDPESKSLVFLSL